GLEVMCLHFLGGRLDGFGMAAIGTLQRAAGRVEIELGAALGAGELAPWRRGVGGGGWTLLGMHRSYRGNGGGAAANNGCNSATSAALVHAAIPCCQTSVSRVSEPSRTLAERAAMSKGPACVVPMPTK